MSLKMPRRPKPKFAVNGRPLFEMSAQAENAIRMAMKALEAMDLMILSYETERAKLIKRIQKYRDSKKKGDFERAQEAAIRGDKCEDCIKDLTKMRDVLYERFVKTWTKFTGDRHIGEVIVAYLRCDCDAELALKVYGYSKQEMFTAVSLWESLIHNERIAAKRRFLYIMRKKMVYLNGTMRDTWWVEPLCELLSEKEEEEGEDDGTD